jgi:hypothetical protein
VIGDVNDSARGQIVAAQKTLGIQAGLALSDLVIAETRDGAWPRGHERLAPIPGHQVVAGAAFRLFYELYGVNPGTPLRVRIMVAPGEGEGMLARVAGLLSAKSALSLSFEEAAVLENDGVARISREITADLRPGRYSLQLTVQNLKTGETATRSTDLLVIERTGA